MTTDVNISCPHCRRQYTMKVDPERLQRLKMRATCGRCGNSFDVASRIAASAGSGPKPDLSTLQRVPAPAPPPSLRPELPKTPTSPDLADEMAELAREFADAAARFTPVGVRPVSHAATIEAALQATVEAPLTITMTADDGSDEFDGESITSARKGARSWIDLADPGLAPFKTPPDAAAAALEALLRG